MKGAGCTALVLTASQATFTIKKKSNIYSQEERQVLELFDFEIHTALCSIEMEFAESKLRASRLIRQQQAG